MKKKTFLLMCMLLCASITFADPVEIGGIYYELNSTDKTAATAYKSTALYTGDIIVPSTVTYESVEYTVTSIGNKSFAKQNVTTVTLPNTITSIGTNAFYLSAITSINIPNSVTSIGEYAFGGCVALTSIELPASITTISEGAFMQCISLSSVTLPNTVTSIGTFAFVYCALTTVDIPNSVTTIGEGAFGAMGAYSGTAPLTSVTIPASVTSIGAQAFIGNSNLATVTCYATTPPTAGEYCFYGISSTATLNVPSGTKTDYSAADIWKDSFATIEEMTPTKITTVGADAKNDVNNTLKFFKDGKLQIIKNGHKYNAAGQEF